MSLSVTKNNPITTNGFGDKPLWYDKNTNDNANSQLPIESATAFDMCGNTLTYYLVLWWSTLQYFAIWLWSSGQGPKTGLRYDSRWTQFGDSNTASNIADFQCRIWMLGPSLFGKLMHKKPLIYPTLTYSALTTRLLGCWLDIWLQIVWPMVSHWSQLWAADEVAFFDTPPPWHMTTLRILDIHGAKTHENQTPPPLHVWLKNSVATPLRFLTKYFPGPKVFFLSRLYCILYP